MFIPFYENAADLTIPHGFIYTYQKAHAQWALLICYYDLLFKLMIMVHIL